MGTDATMFVDVPVQQRILEWNGEPTTLRRTEADGQVVALPDKEQPRVADFLCSLLNRYAPPPDKPTMLTFVQRQGRHIMQAKRESRPYRTGQLGLGILQEAWKQNAALPVDHGARLRNLTLGQIAPLIGLAPPAESLPLIGLEEIEEAEGESPAPALASPEAAGPAT